MPTLRELQERRAFECRLTPDRALETLDAAEEFLRERGVLTLMATSSLPSLFGARLPRGAVPGRRARLRRLAQDEVPVGRLPGRPQ